MGEDESSPQVSTDSCTCLARRHRTVRFHTERQDTAAPGWLRLLDLIDEAAADGRTTFRPLAEMSADERRQVITLPPTIAKLTAVEHLVLYGSNLVRIPREIGAMTNLKVFEPYTSYRLHWFPYEITRCTKLVSSTVSTRALYGNYKYRPPFPATSDSDSDARDCSVCDGPITRLHQVWITLGVGADHLPLLVNACSADCVAALPRPAAGYAPAPHTGGPARS